MEENKMTNDSKTKVSFPKKIFLLFIFCFSFTLFSLPRAHADQPKGPGPKFFRGFFYVAASPLQWPKEIIDRTSHAYGPAATAPVEGFFVGAFTGTFNLVRQVGVGLVDMFTFPLPLHNNWAPLYERPTIAPEI